MVYALLTLNSLLMILLPLLLGIWLVHRYRVSWKLFLIGAAGFVVSQIGHIPLNQFVLNPFVRDFLAQGETVGRVLLAALLFGLSAGLFEEGTRYLFYYFRKSMRDWDEGLMFGAGWGGIEAILLGLLAAATMALEWAASVRSRLGIGGILGPAALAAGVHVSRPALWCAAPRQNQAAKEYWPSP